MLVGLKWNLGIRQNKLFPYKNTFNNHKPTYEDLQTVQCYVKVVILWLSELQRCKLYTKKQKKCLFKQTLFATTNVGTNPRRVSYLVTIGPAFVWSEELARSRRITLSEICIILQIMWKPNPLNWIRIWPKNNTSCVNKVKTTS